MFFLVYTFYFTDEETGPEIQFSSTSIRTYSIYSTMPRWFGEMLNVVAATKEFRNSYAEEKQPKDQNMEGPQ